MSDVDKKIFLNFESNQSKFVDEKKILKWLESLEGHFEDIKNTQYSISIKFVSSKTMEKLNLEFLGNKSPTNVLAFPSQIEKDPFHSLGDIAICLQILVEEAKNQDKRLEDHLAHIFIHGVLHLVGYKHNTSSGAKEMESIEIKVLNKLGIDNPY